MYWAIAGILGYFIIAHLIYKDIDIKEMISGSLEHLVISILWLPFVIIVPAVYLIVCFINTFSEK